MNIYAENHEILSKVKGYKNLTVTIENQYSDVNRECVKASILFESGIKINITNLVLGQKYKASVISPQHVLLCKIIQKCESLNFSEILESVKNHVPELRTNLQIPICDSIPQAVL